MIFVKESPLISLDSISHICQMCEMTRGARSTRERISSASKGPQSLLHSQEACYALGALGSTADALPSAGGAARHFAHLTDVRN